MLLGEGHLVAGVAVLVHYVHYKADVVVAQVGMGHDDLEVHKDSMEMVRVKVVKLGENSYPVADGKMTGRLYSLFLVYFCCFHSLLVDFVEILLHNFVVLVPVLEGYNVNSCRRYFHKLE